MMDVDIKLVLGRPNFSLVGFSLLKDSFNQTAFCHLKMTWTPARLSNSNLPTLILFIDAFTPYVLLSFSHLPGSGRLIPEWISRCLRGWNFTPQAFHFQNDLLFTTRALSSLVDVR